MKKMIKNIICITIILVIGFTSMSFAFSDTENHWGKEYIDLAAELGIIDGFEDGTYKPNNILTREQFAKILVVALNIEPTEEEVIDFIDIPDGYWSEKYVEAAYKYLTGYKFGDGYIYNPKQPAVREDVAVAVVKAKGLDKKEANLKLLDQFSDKDKISEDLKKYVALAVEYGIMQGKGGYFDPQGSLTRAEGATLIIKSLDKVVIDDEIEEDDTLLDDVQFLAFKNEMAAVKDMVTVAMNNAKGEEALRGNSRTNAQLYNFIARGGKNVLTYNDEGDKKWLVQSDAMSIPCTKIEVEYAEDVLGMKLPTRYIETHKNGKEYYSYFVTPKGEVFCWPPYEYEGKSYVNENTKVTNKSGKELNVLEATKVHEAYIILATTNEKVIISNELGVTPIAYKRGFGDCEGIGVWYSKSNKIEGIDFSKYDNTESLYYGDVNDDGHIDYEDEEDLYEVIYGTKTFSSINQNKADVNNDGKISEIDYLILQNYIWGSSNGIKLLPHNCNKFTMRYINTASVDEEFEHREVYYCECGITLLKLIEEHEFVNNKCECGFEKIEEPKKDYEGTIYEEAVRELYERKIIAFYEDGNYHPEILVTRAEFAKLLVIEEGLEKAADVARGETIYSDVSKYHWATGYINIASEYGFMGGYPDGTFAPDSTITYAEAITNVLRTLGYESVIENKGTWPTNYITKARELKLLDDMDYNSYTDKATRGNVAILIYNMLDVEKWEVKVIVTGDVNLDGKVSGLDYSALESYLKGNTKLSSDAKLSADVNLDDVIDENDLIILKAFNLKLIKNLPHKCNVTVSYSRLPESKHMEMIECDCGEIDYIETLRHKFINGKCVCGEQENKIAE